MRVSEIAVLPCCGHLAIRHETLDDGQVICLTGHCKVHRLKIPVRRPAVKKESKSGMAYRQYPLKKSGMERQIDEESDLL